MQSFPTREPRTHPGASSPPASSRSVSEQDDNRLFESAFEKVPPRAPFASLISSPQSVVNNFARHQPVRLELLEKIRGDLARSNGCRKRDEKVDHKKSGSYSCLKDADILDTRNALTPGGIRGLGRSLNSTSEELKTSASTPMGTVSTNPTQKSRLVEINAQLAGYERSLEQRTMSTVQTETTKIQLFKDAIASIEKKVNHEVRQRIESHRQLKNVRK